MRADSAFDDHVDLPPQQCFAVLPKSNVVQQGSARFQIHEEIDVAIRPQIAANARTKNSHITRPVPRRDSEDLCTVTLDEWIEHFRPFYAQTSGPDINQIRSSGPGFSTRLPHFLQIRRLSSFQNASIVSRKCSTMSLQSNSMSSTSAPHPSQ